MRTAPKVSVIVPNYNHAQFLDARMQSILSQSFRDFEIIYLDDASTDQSPLVFQKYSSSSGIRGVVNENNSGCVFKQWNEGVRLARGEYIWIAESDDVAGAAFLDRLVKVLDDNSQVGVVYCRSEVIDGAGTFWVSWFPAVPIDGRRTSLQQASPSAEISFFIQILFRMQVLSSFVGKYMTLSAAQTLSFAWSAIGVHGSRCCRSVILHMCPSR